MPPAARAEGAGGGGEAVRWLWHPRRWPVTASSIRCGCWGGGRRLGTARLLQQWLLQSCLGGLKSRPSLADRLSSALARMVMAGAWARMSARPGNASRATAPIASNSRTRPLNPILATPAQRAQAGLGRAPPWRRCRRHPHGHLCHRVGDSLCALARPQLRSAGQLRRTLQPRPRPPPGWPRSGRRPAGSPPSAPLTWPPLRPPPRREPARSARL